MGYISLGKLYYSDHENYSAEYARRFSSPETIKLDFEIHGNQAFFVQTTEVTSRIFQILKADKRISVLSKELPGIAIGHFTKRCLIDEIFLTNKIEGVYSTRREIAVVLEELNNPEKSGAKRRRFYGLVAKYEKLIEKEIVPLDTCEDIRALYDEIVLPEVAAEDPSNIPDGNIFRKDSASIKTATDKEIHRGVYPESAIVQEMKRALACLNDSEIEVLYRIVYFHYLLEYIHPFYDGNGRLGRFIVSYLLAQELDPLLAYRISFTITENISEYYSAFRVCNDTKNLGDITPFIIMMLEMVCKSIIQLETALENRKTRLDKYSGLIPVLPGGTSNRTRLAYYGLIQAGLFAEDGVSTREFKKFLETSYTTAKAELDLIDKEGFLKKKRVGRENYYMLDLEKLDALLLEQAEN